MRRLTVHQRAVLDGERGDRKPVVVSKDAAKEFANHHAQGKANAACNVVTAVACDKSGTIRVRISKELHSAPSSAFAPQWARLEHIPTYAMMFRMKKAGVKTKKQSHSAIIVTRYHQSPRYARKRHLRMEASSAPLCKGRDHETTWSADLGCNIPQPAQVHGSHLDNFIVPLKHKPLVYRLAGHFFLQPWNILVRATS